MIQVLIRRIHEAKTASADVVRVWGSGRPRRELLFVDDMAAGSVYVMNMPREDYLRHTQPMPRHINVGFGEDVTIAELAETIAKVVEFTGRIEFDTSKSDGAPRKPMNSGRLRSLGWRPGAPLQAGLQIAHAQFAERDTHAAHTEH